MFFLSLKSLWVDKSFEDNAVSCERTVRASWLRLSRTVSHEMKKVAIGIECPAMEADKERKSRKENDSGPE